MPKGKALSDKRVYDLRIAVESHQNIWRVVSVSAESTIPELYWTVQGAFEAPFVTAHHIAINNVVYKGGKGIRTQLRSVFEEFEFLKVFDVLPGFHANGFVLNSEVVASRRHYPKVLDGLGELEGARRGRFTAQSATWAAQGACRGEYLTYLESRALGF